MLHLSSETEQNMSMPKPGVWLLPDRLNYSQPRRCPQLGKCCDWRLPLFADSVRRSRDHCRLLESSWSRSNFEKPQRPPKHADGDGNLLPKSLLGPAKTLDARPEVFGSRHGSCLYNNKQPVSGARQGSSSAWPDVQSDRHVSPYQHTIYRTRAFLFPLAMGCLSFSEPHTFSNNLVVPTWSQ